jgi:nucleoid-associated protein YgaU
VTIDEILHFNLNPILLLHGMNASNKQEALVKSLTSAWEKKNSKVARAGGVSLMALTLAACGGSDDTPFSQVDVDSAVTAANAAAAAEAAAAATAAAASEAAAVAAAEATAAEAATAAATAAAASEAAAVAAAEATAAEAATAAASSSSIGSGGSSSSRSDGYSGS